MDIFRKFETTVQLFVPHKNGENKILLVHEKGDDGNDGKPPGWGMPGGGVDDKTEEEMLEQIIKFLPVYSRIPMGEELEKMINEILNFKIVVDPKISWTCVKEGIEETGLVIRPERHLFMEPTNFYHGVEIIEGAVIAGKLSRKRLDIDDCGWFPIHDLPKGTYPSHRYRINKANEIVKKEREK